MQVGNNPKINMGSKTPLFQDSHAIRLAVFLAATLLLGGMLCGIVFAQAGDADENAAVKAAGAAAGTYSQDPFVAEQKKTKISAQSSWRANSPMTNSKTILTTIIKPMPWRVGRSWATSTF